MLLQVSEPADEGGDAGGTPSISKHSVSEGVTLWQEEQCRFTSCWCKCSMQGQNSCTDMHKLIYTSIYVQVSLCFSLGLFLMFILFLKTDLFYNEFV